MHRSKKRLYSITSAAPCAGFRGCLQRAQHPPPGRLRRNCRSHTMHRQPTPRSIAGAEVQLGDVSKEQAEAVGAAMVRAREADRLGDKSACEQALSDAERALSQR